MSGGASRSRIAIYPGSFDPVTNGHVDLVERSLRLFDRVIVAVLVNEAKAPLFSAAERVQLIREALDGHDRVEVETFDGLLVEYAARRGATAIVRGLRAVADFEYELQMANMNRHLSPDIETMFLMANDAYFYVSSNLVKEAARLGGDVTRLVPDSVASRLTTKLGR